MNHKIDISLKSLFYILILTASSWSQNQTDIYSHLKNRFEQIQNKQTVTDNLTNTEFNALIENSDPNKLLNFIHPYTINMDVSVRSLALDIELKVIEFHSSSSIKRSVVKNLVTGLVGKNEIDHQLRWKYGKSLLYFSANDFNDSTKNAITLAFQDENQNKELLLVIGVAQLTQILPKLNELLLDEMSYRSDPNMRLSPKWYYTTGWFARLARARIGIKEDITKCIELAEIVKDSNERVLRILPDIGYIRQPEAIEYLKKYLESNKRLHPTTPGLPGELYASQVMHILAESLENFPVKKKEARNYTQEEIDLCRKWMSEQSEWVIRR